MGLALRKEHVTARPYCHGRVELLASCRRFNLTSLSLPTSLNATDSGKNDQAPGARRPCPDFTVALPFRPALADLKVGASPKLGKHKRDFDSALGLRVSKLVKLGALSLDYGVEAKRLAVVSPQGGAA